jgi:hypothetical protein
MSYDRVPQQLQKAMSNLSTPNLLAEPTPMAPVKSCRQSSDMERQFGVDFALSAGCSR